MNYICTVLFASDSLGSVRGLTKQVIMILSLLSSLVSHSASFGKFPMLQSYEKLMSPITMVSPEISAY